MRKIKGMIDSHAHLIWDSFDTDRTELMERAKDAGLTSFIHPCVELTDWAKMKNLQDEYENIKLALGVHPCHAQTWKSEESQQFITEQKPQIIAIGETGLDKYHLDLCDIETQEVAFREQAFLAKELKLPLIIHCRDAFPETLEILREINPGAGVMHCYTGDAEFAESFWELGFYLSFGGAITFKNAGSLREQVKKIPLERCLIETDCPFLSPQKWRGKRNEPSFITEVARVLAEIHGVSQSSAAGITEQNTRKLFNF